MARARAQGAATSARQNTLYRRTAPGALREFLQEDTVTVKRSSDDSALWSDARWLKTFEQYDVKYLALDPEKDHSLIQLLQARPEWMLDFWDREGVLFVHSDVVQAQTALAV